MFEKFYDFVGVENKNNVTDMSGFMGDVCTTLPAITVSLRYAYFWHDKGSKYIH